MSYKNSEGYSDPTAGVAMGSAKKQEQEIDKLNHKVMQSFRLLLDLAGFEIVGRVTLRHKKSGRMDAVRYFVYTILSNQLAKLKTMKG